jgi:uncharacterized protein (DUF2132 family)
MDRRPLDGVTLATILTDLVEHHGFAELGRRIDIKCFQVDPSIKSSLTFLRRTPWARDKVEELYLRRARALRRRARKTNARTTTSDPIS